MPPTAVIIAPSGEFPNSATLPVLIYRQAFSGDGASAAAIEKRFRANGWDGTWVNGLYTFHHYHSRGHEALGVSDGWVEIQLGGPDGTTCRLEKGDAVILPAGVAHKKTRSGKGFRIVGAYPPKQWPDMNTGKPGERAAAEKIIAALPLPSSDPVEGAGGTPLRHDTRTGRPDAS